MIYGRQLLDTLHERVGEEELLRGNPALGDSDRLNGMWGRFIFRHGKTDGDPVGIYGDGPSYRSDLLAFQIGMDVYRHQEKRSDGSYGDRDHVGLMGSIGMVEANVDHNLLTLQIPAGKVELNGYSIGAYWTHFEPNGAYLDGVVQGTWYDAKIKSPRLPRIRTAGFGIAVSLEGGYPIRLNDDWRLEPQAQVIYQALDLDEFSDPASTVRFDNLDSLVGRIGLRLASNGKNQGWLRGNILHEFLGKPRTEFSSADGFVPFRSDLSRTWWQVGLGMNLSLHPRLTLFGAANYEATFDGKSRALEGKFGVRVNW